MTTTDVRLSEHFMLDEFTASETAHEHGIDNTPASWHLGHIKILVTTMEQVRALFGRSIHISSGYRCPVLNKLVGGVPESDHALGYACDFHVAGVSDMEAACRIASSPLKFDQLIWERGRCVHLSVNPRMRRQVLSQPGGPGSPVHVGIS